MKTLRRRSGERLFGAVLAASTLVGGLVVSSGVGPASAASANEILTSVTFDGTAPFATDPVDDVNVYPSPHTPGLDERGDNGVVRSHDTFGVRIDWNINEEAATNVVLTSTLPAGYTWADQPATNPPDPEIFAGCLTATHGVTPTSSISADRQTLICNVGDQTEGSNGTIFPIVLVGEVLDGEQVSVSATLTTDDDASGVSDAIDGPLDISARPFGDWVKDEPELVENVDNGGTDGSLLIFPLTFSWSLLERGSERLNDASAINFYDHPWDIPNAELATAAMMPGGRTPCGQFDGGAPLITNGTWTCTDIGDQGQGYSTVQIGITGHNTAALADAVSLHGQIAFWIPQADLDARMAIAQPQNSVYNSITGSAADVITFDKTANPPESPADDITPILVAGTNIIADETTTENNSARYSDNPSIIPPGGTLPGVARGFVMQTVSMQSGRYQQLSYATQGDASLEVLAPDMRNDSVGGVHSFVDGTSAYRWLGTFGPTLAVVPPISRGEEFFITASVGAQHSRSTSVFDDPFAACVSLDLDNYELIPFGDFTEFSIPHDPFGEPYFTTANGSQTLSPSDGELGHVLTGRNSMGAGTWNQGGTAEEHTGAVIGGELDYAVEFSTDAAQLGNNAPEDGVNCSDSVGTWQDASAVTAGDFPNISMVRIRLLERVPWTGDIYPNEFSYPTPAFEGPELYPGPMMTLNLQAQVKSDVNVQVDGEELFVYVSRGLGAWDNGVGQPEGVYTDWVNAAEGDLGTYDSSCRINQTDPADVTAWTDNLSTTTTTTGWCNEPYVDALLPENIDYGSVGQQGNRTHEYHADKRYIAAVKPLVDKDNVDGVNDYADNGDLVQFSLKPSVEGATAEALSNVVMIDDLTTTNYEFVQFIQQPSFAPPCTEAGNIITCQLSEPDPTVDTDPALAAGLPGGWSDEVIIEVVVQGGVAGIIPTFNQNSTTITSTGIGPWDGAAFTQPVQDENKEWTSIAGSYMPPPVNESAIIKAVSTLEGPCVSHPDLATLPAGWADRCSLIDFDGNMEFSLSLTNEGNSVLNNIRFVDVFPNNSDETEPASNTDVDGVAVPTLGDGRTPDSDFDGTLSYVSLTAGGTTVWLTADDPTTVSRDPDRSITGTTWCDALGGTVQNPGNTGSGVCPAASDEVTATYTALADPLFPDETYTQTLILDSEGASCDNIWTNSFGARSDEILLPIRSNDVSVMVNCEFDLALKKVIDPSWTPAADWLTVGTSTVDFVLEIENQGDPVEDFDVTDYLGSTWVIEAASNPSGNTGGDQALPYTWDLSDPDAPVVAVDGALAPTEKVTVPVTLAIDSSWLGGDLDNYAEISRFDSDGDPSNGDSDPANSNNPNTGPLVDEDSTPDAVNGEEADGKLEDDVTNENTTVGDLSLDGVIDEDDHDIASVPFYDLELVKTVRTPGVITSTTPFSVVFNIAVSNQGPLDVYGIAVTEYGATGLTYDATATAALWASESVSTVSDASPTFTIAGPVAANETFTFPVVFQLTDLDAAPYTNAAEISAFDNDADPGNALPASVVDVDSTPDSTNDDDLIDHTAPNYDPDSDSNLNEPTPGDEDDHDVATVTLAVYSLGNQVWVDADNDGQLETGEAVLAGVVVDLFVDDNGDGMPDDTNGDGKIDSADAIATAITDSDGAYLFTNLEAGTYVVGVAPSNWDAGGPLYGMLPSDVVEEDPDTDIDDDNNGFVGKDGYVSSGPVTISSDEPLDESGFNNDSGTPDGLSNLTVDFGFWEPQFDLALRKTVVDKALTYKIGDIVTYNIEVFNQGNTDALDITVIDYLPIGTELADTQWSTSAGGQITRVIDGPLSPGDSVSVTIAVRLVSVGDGPVVNNAEISEAVPARVGGAPLVLPSGLPVPDVDSVADATDSENAVDDVIDNAQSDEDDHDGAVIEVANIPPTLPTTGSTIYRALKMASYFILAGLGLVLLRRRRRRILVTV